MSASEVCDGSLTPKSLLRLMLASFLLLKLPDKSGAHWLSPILRPTKSALAEAAGKESSAANTSLLHGDFILISVEPKF